MSLRRVGDKYGPVYLISDGKVIIYCVKYTIVPEIY